MYVNSYLFKMKFNQRKESFGKVFLIIHEQYFAKLFNLKRLLFQKTT